MQIKSIEQRPEIKGLYRTLAAPHITTFGECFDAFEPYTTKCKFKPQFIYGPSIAKDDDSMQVGPYCLRSGKPSLAVRCTDWVLSRILANTPIVEHDSIHFEIIDHEKSGFSLVLAQHNQIIGSVWLAYIRTDSIPVLEETP